MDNNTDSKKTILIPAITWLIRILVGGVFIFSGFVKSIDPWGTIYKIKDYSDVLGIDIWPNLLLTGVFILCAGEFLLGVFLVLGCFRRSTPILLAAIMAVMLPLTLWIALTNPVADCGCFGDAMKISNSATFWKNVVLSALIIWLLKYNRKCRCIVEPFAQWLAFTASALYIISIAIIGYQYQPLIDFRTYKEGEDIIDFSEGRQNSDPETEFLFIYEKAGNRKEFLIDDELPDENSGWKFIERKERKSSDNSANNNSEATDQTALSEDHNLRLWDEEGNEDLTEEVLTVSGQQILLMMPELDKVSVARTWQINSLYTWAERNNIDLIAVVSGSPADISYWKDISLATYPIYTADDTQIKEVVRGNPAVVFINNGKIVWKSTLSALQTDDFLSPDTAKDPASFHKDNRRILINLSLIYISVILFLIVLSYSPAMSRFFMLSVKKFTSQS